MVDQPMLDLHAVLRAHALKTFMVSCGGIEFMRPWAERVCGIPHERVAGSSVTMGFALLMVSCFWSGCR